MTPDEALAKAIQYAGYAEELWRYSAESDSAAQQAAAAATISQAFSALTVAIDTIEAGR